MSITTVLSQPKPPCKDCESRHLACHDECKKFKKYRKLLDEFNEFIRNEKFKEDIGLPLKKSRR